MGPLLSSCWIFCFFFGACRCLVHLFVCPFLFLVPVNVLWSQSHQTCPGTKKNKKKQTTRCTKPAQAPKKTKKLKKNQELWVHFWVVAGICVFLVFFWCLSMFGASSGLFSLVFFVFVNVFVYLMSRSWWKNAFYQGFRPSKCIKHRDLQCFIIIFNENSLPHGVPPSRNIWVFNTRHLWRLRPGTLWTLHSTNEWVVRPKK